MEPLVVYDGLEADSIVRRSSALWQSIRHAADNMAVLPASSLDLRGVLRRTPSLPGKLPSSSRWIEGYSAWKNLDLACPLAMKSERAQRLHLRSMHPVPCTVCASHSFVDWEGEPNNGIALLVLGWSYVLSASLAERQDLRMEYRTQQSLETTSTAPERRLHLDYASPEELAWWTAITRPGVGWSIEGDQVAPWSILVQDIGLQVTGNNCDTSQQPAPPTAEQAARYLARFCQVYGLGAQCAAALAAVLSLPLHSSTRPTKPVAIELPMPRLTDRVTLPSRFSLRHRDQDHPPPPPDFAFLGHYMALSLSLRIFGASLWSVFWDPDVPCNFAGAWMGPIATVIQPIVESNDLKLLAKLLSFTNVAPLWLGVALCGRKAIINSIVPFLTQARDYARPNVDAAAWSGTPQSFLDTAYLPRPALRDGMIARAEVWRLRHDCHGEYEDGADYSYIPPYGWPPFGQMREEDVELEIRNHVRCSHRWRYVCWNWSIPDGTVDTGFMPDSDEPSSSSAPKVYAASREGMEGYDGPKESDNIRQVSETVTKAVFWWSCDQVEKGFGNTIVPLRFYSKEPPSSSRGSPERPSVDRKAIQKWARGVCV